jgi:imidazolonepropionase-like amidohydrolase
VRAVKRRAFVAVTVLAALVVVGSVPRAAAELAVRAGVAYPVSGPPVRDAVVLVEAGKIVRIGPATGVSIPHGIEVLEAAVVTPGLVDVHSVVGLAGIYNSDKGQVQDQDQLETSDPLQPELRAIDAYDPVEPLVEWVRSLGVTTLHTGHGPGAVVSGQTLVAKTRGETVAEAVLVPAVAVAATLGRSISDDFATPGTRAKTAADLRAALVAAEHYRTHRAGDKPPDRDLGLETLAAVLDGELALMITAHTASDIATALRLQREFGFRLWLDGAAEAYRMIDELRQPEVSVLLHATMLRSRGEATNLALDTAARLAGAGLPFAIQTGFEPYVPKTRVLLYEAAVAVHAGLDPADALRAITLEPARILGLADRIGSLEPGKDADLVLYDGDPFEYTTHVCRVLIEGRTVSDVCR